MGDDAALRKLIREYGRAIDAREFDAAAALFTDDGVLVVRGRETHGRDAIAAAFRSLERYDETRHVVGEPAIAVGGVRATADTPCAAHHIDNTGDRVLTITYHDSFERCDGVWRIARRELVVT